MNIRKLIKSAALTLAVTTLSAFSLAGYATAAENISLETILETSELFSNRDLKQEAELEEAVYVTLTDGDELRITEAGVYVLSGTASEAAIYVEAGDDDKVQLVLDGLTIENESSPCIYVLNADKVFVTTSADSAHSTLDSTVKYRRARNPV